jgi:peptide/nickel transport system permease protein
MGLTRSNLPVIEVLQQAIPVTIKLVITATFLAIILGISVGMITAIRQYSRFDYSMTFVSFLLFSLPIFWVAVLLKEFMAIQYNDFLASPQIPPVTLILFSLTFGFIGAGFVGGSKKQFTTILLGGAIFAAGLLFFASSTDWFIDPSLGLFGVTFLAFSNAALVIQLISGLDSKKGLRTGFGTALSIAVLYYPLQTLMSKMHPFLTL